MSTILILITHCWLLFIDHCWCCLLLYFSFDDAVLTSFLLPHLHYIIDNVSILVIFMLLSNLVFPFYFINLLAEIVPLSIDHEFACLIRHIRFHFHDQLMILLLVSIWLCLVSTTLFFFYSYWYPSSIMSSHIRQCYFCFFGFMVS